MLRQYYSQHRFHEPHLLPQVCEEIVQYSCHVGRLILRSSSAMSIVSNNISQFFNISFRLENVSFANTE